ncbi:MAG: hypothetical protein L0K86_11875 [Actinomycetia bacterium]|nr:hypothetical protein [Actinomycetes bacterium]
MPAPLVEAYDAFYPVGKCVVNIVTTMADYNAPTRAELNAGTDVTRQTKMIEGWAAEGEQIDRPDYAALFTSKIGGRQNAADSSLVIYAKQTGLDIRQTLIVGYNGFVVLMPGGDITGYKMDVFPVLVRSKPKQWTDSDPFAIQYQFSIRQPPAEDLTIPA